MFKSVRTSCTLLILLIKSAASGKMKMNWGKRKFNILFIGTDQQRTSTLGCYGNKFAHSPNLDKLADDGVRFTDAFTVSPVCSPSRTSVLLGVHVPVHGVFENGFKPWRTGCTPFFDQLKKQAYHTALIGKTHFHPIPSTIDFLDEHSGHDMRTGKESYSKFLETYLVDSTMRWISSLSAKGKPKPWFVYLSMSSPHPPNWVPRGPWSNVYKQVELPPLNYRQGNIGELPYQTRMLLYLLGKEQGYLPAFPQGKANMTYIDNVRYEYYTQAAYVDHEIGRMMEYLDKHKLTEKTLVIFASDHGAMLYDHGIGNDKHTFLDPSLRVPLIMRLPGVLPRKTTQRFATTIDITATILAAAGADIPTDYQGFDLLTPIYAGQKSPREVGVATEYRAHALVSQRWKLAYFPEKNEGRLWDREADPLEQNNLFQSSDKDITEVRGKLMMALFRWRALLDPIAEMKAHTSNAGFGKGSQASSVAAWNHTMHLKGIRGERQLQWDVAKFDAR